MTSSSGQVVPNNVRRRVIGAGVGKAVLVSDPDAVDHKQGRFLKIPQDEMELYLSNQVINNIESVEVVRFR